jgi:hypothetical protein
MGIELLSPSPEAYGARWVNKQRQPLSNYFKALLLPEIKTMGQKTTIILAEPLPDQTPYLIIEKNGKEKLLEIQDCLQNSTAFQQYSVRFCEILADSACSGNMFVTNELTIDSLDSEISISSQ